jgi:4-hydroxy-tetrahydrodipicolinate synthase
MVVSLNTPFDDHDRIDWSSLERLVAMHLREGAAGFLVAAQAGEVFSLTPEERLQLVRSVRSLTRGQASVIAGATARDNDLRIQVAEEAVKIGCDGVLVEPPVELRDDPDSLVAFFRTFASVGMPMLMIQDLDWHGSGMRVSLIAQLFAEIKPFRCLKVEVSPAGPKYTQVLAATGGRLHVSGGWASLQMIEALDRGVGVFMSTAMTGWYRRILDAYKAGSRAEAIGNFHRILPVLSFTRQHLDISIQFYKRLFHHRGIFSTARSRKLSVCYDSYHEKCGNELIRYLDNADAALAEPS